MKIAENVPLKELSTFRIGGPARYFVEVSSAEELRQAFEFCNHKSIRYHILGKGSNSLFDDQGFDGMVIRNKIDFFTQTGNEVYVGAGYSFALLGSKTARLGLGGLEFALGIPATVGGAIYMNAGAQGQEVADTLVSVEYMTSTGETQLFQRVDLTFSYRYSSFQTHCDGAITGATFSCTPQEDAKEKQKALIDYRMHTQPYGEASAGCIFRNLNNISAGALIDQSGLKGYSIGGAQISTQHANFIVNQSNASAKDVMNLIEFIKKSVRHLNDGLEMECEIRFIPYSKENI